MNKPKLPGKIMSEIEDIDTAPEKIINSSLSSNYREYGR